MAFSYTSEPNKTHRLTFTAKHVEGYPWLTLLHAGLYDELERYGGLDESNSISMRWKYVLQLVKMSISSGPSAAPCERAMVPFRTSAIVV